MFNLERRKDEKDYLSTHVRSISKVSCRARWSSLHPEYKRRIVLGNDSISFFTVLRSKCTNTIFELIRFQEKRIGRRFLSTSTETMDLLLFISIKESTVLTTLKVVDSRYRSRMRKQRRRVELFSKQPLLQPTYSFDITLFRTPNLVSPPIISSVNMSCEFEQRESSSCCKRRMIEESLI